MTKLHILACLVALFTISLTQAQENTETNNSKFSILAFGGIGYGIMDNDNAPNYNMNSNTGDVLLNYQIHSNFGIATGIGFNQLSGNGFNTSGNFYHDRLLIKLPVLMTFKNEISDTFSLVGHLGFYTQNLINDEYTFISGKIKDVYGGWNFGFQAGIGFVFQIDTCFGIGVHFASQSDFTKLETENNAIFKDEQKLKSFNTFGLVILFNL